MATASGSVSTTTRNPRHWQLAVLVMEPLPEITTSFGHQIRSFDHLVGAREQCLGPKPHVHACPLRTKSGGSVIAIRSVAKCRQQSLGYSISLALCGPQARRSALDLDLACDP